MNVLGLAERIEPLIAHMLAPRSYLESLARAIARRQAAQDIVVCGDDVDANLETAYVLHNPQGCGYWMYYAGYPATGYRHTSFGFASTPDELGGSSCS